MADGDIHIDSNPPRASSPASTGPAGASLEASVGGFYLLALVANGEPRGLPGATITSVQFQQAAFGFPMDDVVVLATNADGSPATLEIQCKRSMTFTASDSEFADVVARFWRASQKAEFATTRYELAVAIAKTTTRIEKDCQEVLRWSRELPDGATFAAYLARPGFASEGMRSFLAVFRANLRAVGGMDDEDTVWRLLRRFLILVFDFESPGSEFLHHAIERCGTVLLPQDAGRKSQLWTALCERSMQASTAAGVRDRATLVRDLSEQHGFAFLLRADLRATLVRVKDDTRNALADIQTTVAGVCLARTEYALPATVALDAVRVLGITGAPGTGKSALLKQLAELQCTEGTTIVLSRGRIVSGGWTSWAQTVTCPVPQTEMLNELACVGGATLFIDNLDQVAEDGQLATVHDLLRAALAGPGWRVVFTASDTRQEWLSRFPELAANPIQTIAVAELSDAEAAQLSVASPALAQLLHASHPARGLARNLFHLSRMVALAGGDRQGLHDIATEVGLAQAWWTVGGGRSDASSLARLRVLRAIGERILTDPSMAATRVDELDSDTVAELLRFDALREHKPRYSVTFRHDVLRDWTIGFLLSDDPAHLDRLELTTVIPPAVTRGLEFAARRMLAADATGAQWRELVARLSSEGAHGSWRRQAILALTRAEDAPVVLEGQKDALLADKGKLLSELISVVMSVEATPLAQLLKDTGATVDIPAGAEGFMVPRGNSWTWLVLWIAIHAQEVPPPIIPDIARLFQSWLLATQSKKDELRARVVEIIFDWLKRSDEVLKPKSYRDFREIPYPDFTFPHMREARDELRSMFANFCDLTPTLAKRYLDELDADALRYGELESLLCFPGAFVRAAPEAFATFALASLAEDEDEEGSGYGYRRRTDTLGPFTHHSHHFLPASPGQGPFFELLLASPGNGLRLIHGIVDQSAEWWRDGHDRNGATLPSLTIPFPEGARIFEGGARAYGWSRSESASSITTSALMALEAWGHREIDAGRSPAEVIGDVLGASGSSIALVAVAVDLALSHWSVAYPVAWPFLASPELLRYDDWRYAHDISGNGAFRPFLQQEGTHWKVKRADLEARSSRRLRLWDRIGEIVLGTDEAVRKALQSAVAAAQERIAATPDDDGDPVDGLKACARRAWRMTDPANWSPVAVTRSDGSTAQMLQFVMEEDEARHRQQRQQEALAGSQACNMRFAIQNELLKQNKSTHGATAQAVAWARVRQAATPPEDEFEQQWDRRAVLMAAALAVRDYASEDRAEVLRWALELLVAVASETPKRYEINPQVEYSAQAIAAFGLMLYYEQTGDIETRSRLLLLATTKQPAVINAIGSRFRPLFASKPEFVRSLLRIGVASSVYVWAEDDEMGVAKKGELLASIEGAIEAEKIWLDHGGSEPAWSELPAWHTRKRRYFRIGTITRDSEEDTEPPSFMLIAHEQALGDWISQAVPLTLGGVPPWLLVLSDKLFLWTTQANAAPDMASDPDHRPFNWNASFFDFLGIASVALPASEAIVRFVEPLCAYGEEAFCDCASAFLRGFDRAMAATDTLRSDDPSAIRSCLAGRMRSMRNFRRLATRQEFTAERHLADLISAMYFHSAPLALGHNTTVPFALSDHPALMLSLTELVVAAPSSGYLATSFLNMIEQQADPALAPYMIRALSAWCTAYGASAPFWVDHDIGKRVCRWLLEVIGGNTVSVSAPARIELSSSLDTMIRSGVGLARQVEQRLG